jgi:hypothetical protein
LPIQIASRVKFSIVPVGYDLVDGDQDFHIVNLTPSVTLLTEVKPHSDGNGQLPSLYKDNLPYHFVYVSCVCILLFFVCVSSCA